MNGPLKVALTCVVPRLELKLFLFFSIRALTVKGNEWYFKIALTCVVPGIQLKSGFF